MKTIIIKIDKKQNGIAIGKDVFGTKVYVVNGDLKNQTEIETILLEQKNDKLITEIIETYDSEKIISKHSNG
jgi:hypothetical protein